MQYCRDQRRAHLTIALQVLELIGTTTLLDSLQCASQGGAVCMTGMVGNKWTLDEFTPMGSIPTAVNLTTYAGGPEEFIETPLEDLVQQIAQGKLKVQVTPPLACILPSLLPPAIEAFLRILLADTVIFFSKELLNLHPKFFP